MPDNDPNAFYDVAPAPQGRLGLWMVTSTTVAFYLGF